MCDGGGACSGRPVSPVHASGGDRASLPSPPPGHLTRYGLSVEPSWLQEKAICYCNSNCHCHCFYARKLCVCALYVVLVHAFHYLTFFNYLPTCLHFDSLFTGHFARLSSEAAQPPPSLQDPPFPFAVPPVTVVPVPAPPGKETVTVHLLAPCYSFPGLSFLSPPLSDHVSVTLLAPSCSPQ